jgi:hypothetical protein
MTGSPVQEVVEALRQELGDDLRGVVLFGSRARGEGRPESDWDLLVVADALPSSPLERGQALTRVVPPRWRGRVAILGRTPREFETQFPSYYLDLGLDGRILFDRNGYLEARLGLIRQRIHEGGLRRRRIGRGFMWSWETPPPGPWRIDWSGMHGLGGTSNSSES